MIIDEITNLYTTVMRHLGLKSIGRRFLRREIAIVFSFFLVGFTAVHQLRSPGYQIPYPDGYREWTHIKTSLTGFTNNPQQKGDGWQHIYANDKAMTGYKSGTFPDGAIIVFDKREVDTTAGVIQAGKRKFIDVMFKNSKVFKETGGWGFEEFSGDSKTEGRLSGLRQLNCFQGCHQSRSSQNFVFSEFRN